MIRTVILGADTPEGGELIRILAMHPDVEMVSAQAFGMEGVPLTTIHHGLIGETSLLCTVYPNPERCDVIFDFSSEGVPEITSSLLARFPEAKLIRLSGSDKAYAESEYVYALSEINRKQLVRGATRARIPQPLASIALVTLYPLAANLLLPNTDIKLSFEVPDSINTSIDTEAIGNEIANVIQKIQMSWSAKVDIETKISRTRRSVSMSTDIQMMVDLSNVAGLYNMYDDHHFAFALTVPVGPSEVAGTEKCVISLSKPAESTLHIESVADARMRGGAGEAVHVLNLLAGLHERTGLALKAIDFLPLC